MSNKNYHYTYYSYEEWGRGYIGCRSCDCLPEEDINYLGSFYDKTFNPTQKIILETFKTRKDAIRAEINLHNFYDIAANPHFANRAKQTSTRFTQAGISPSKETRKKLSQSGKGKKRSEATKEKISAYQKTKRLKKETKEKLRQANLGKKLSPETIKKRGETRKKNYENGPKKVLSEETRKKISKSLTGRKVGPFSEEHRRKISEANKGKTFIMSEQVKKKISETMQDKHSGEKNPFYNKKHTEETREKMKKAWERRRLRMKEEAPAE